MQLSLLLANLAALMLNTAYGFPSGATSETVYDAGCSQPR